MWIVHQAKFNRIDRHTPAGRRRDGRVGLGRPVGQEDPADQPPLVVQTDRQHFVRGETSLRQRTKWSLLSACCFDHAKSTVFLHESETSRSPGGIVELPHLNWQARAGRKLEFQPTVPAHLDIAVRIEM